MKQKQVREGCEARKCVCRVLAILEEANDSEALVALALLCGAASCSCWPLKRPGTECRLDTDT